MMSSQTTTLDLHMFGNKNIIGHLLPQLQSASLLHDKAKALILQGSEHPQITCHNY